MGGGGDRPGGGDRCRWDRLEALRARGTAALLDHEPSRAAASLGDVWAHTQREGVEEPGVFPVAPDLVEALVELGELEEAQRGHETAADARRAAGASVGARDARSAATAIVGLASEYDGPRRPLRSTRRRTSTGCSGSASSRAGRYSRSAGRGAGTGSGARRAGRSSGPRPRSTELGSSGWADEARAELARVGARRPQPSGELTPAERRVAELAGDGLANKEIARTLFVTVKTVEGHLSHVYAKLGVRSRAQLARRLSGAV